MWSEFFQFEDFLAIRPQIVLTLFALAILGTDFMLEKRDKYINAVTALLGLGFAGVLVILDLAAATRYPVRRICRTHRQ